MGLVVAEQSFENQGEKQYDKIILLTAPENVRIQRVMARDGISETEVRQRMQKQWPDAQKFHWRIMLLIIPTGQQLKTN